MGRPQMGGSLTGQAVMWSPGRPPVRRDLEPFPRLAFIACMALT
ncbi:hypothetical protein [Rhodococcus wratislaviensis]